ncbi:LytR/AlgR family response regulator transcription factor [Aquimarina longa]|uniref:LytR/AlgR family response regulator transcription factor n=1 Tax=Aquimarina longa TaxID=1080221 RepID=UPI0007804ACB|nr:LytTR family DNA-binding domain-containing protein [Aquimarina longa]
MFRSLSRHKILFIHILFWVSYYIVFGFIWVKEDGYKASFYLEFVLLPVRIFCVYFTVLYLIPQFLLKKHFLKFITFYILLLFFASSIQRVFIHFFVDDFDTFNAIQVFGFDTLLRAMVLINSTVFFVSSIYILQYYFKEKERNESSLKEGNRVLELKSNKRIYTISEDEIVHIEGLGNYVTYHLIDNTTIVVYSGLHKTLNELSDNFIRIHKSHIINKNRIKSYNKENIELVNGKLLPIGNSIDYNSILQLIK